MKRFYVITVYKAMIYYNTMKTVNKYYFLWVVLLSLPAILQAKHLVGGSLTYQFLASYPDGTNEYRVKIELYRDCLPGNTDFDVNTDMKVSAFRGDAGNAYVKDIGVFMTSRSFLPITSNNPCVPAPTGICYERAIYEGNVRLPRIAAGYYITWGRCCRNVTIANIVDPGNTGMALSAFIPNMNTYTVNSSPVFTNLAPTYICMGDYFTFDHKATDADGDSLVYSLTVPLTGGSPNDPVPPAQAPANYPPVTWQPPYNTNNVMGGNPPTSINSISGLLTAVPGGLGQFVMSVKVSEYRNGVKLSELARDMQINVINCAVNYPPQVQVSASGQIINDTLLFYAGEQSCFNFNITDINGAGLGQDIITVQASGNIFSGGSAGPPYAVFTSGSGNSPVTASLCWTPGCNAGGNNTGSFTITATDNNTCPGPNVSNKVYYYKILQGNATPPDLRCVSVVDQNQVRLSWINPPSTKLGGFEYYVIERNNGNGWAFLTNITDSLVNSYTDMTANNADNQRYCYRLSTAKTCPSFFVGLPGNEVCSILAASTPVNSVQSLIEWNPYTNWSPSNYEVWSYSGSQEQKEGNILNDTSYLFTGCTFSGFIRIQLKDPVSGCTVYSGKTQNISLQDSLPPANDICVATVLDDDSGILIRWGRFQGDDFRSYRLMRAPRGSNNFEEVLLTQSIDDTVFTDNTVLTDSMSYCYYLEQSDLCNNLQRSGKDCVMNIKGNGQDYRINLFWNNYSGWEPQSSSLELWRVENDVPQSLVSTLSPNATSFTDDNVTQSRPVYCYRLKAIKETGECNETWSNTVCVSFPPTLFFPNAFSPNGDGRNDIFTTVGLYAETFELSIYNRWGTLVFTTLSPTEGWNGKIKGVDAPEGVYVFRAVANGYKGERIEKTGTVTLIR